MEVRVGLAPHAALSLCCTAALPRSLKLPTQYIPLDVFPTRYNIT